MDVPDLRRRIFFIQVYANIIVWHLGVSEGVRIVTIIYAETSRISSDVNV